MKGFHVTTPRKVARYEATGGILPPVRFWRHEASARAWAEKTGRSVVLVIEVGEAHPLPDHKPRGHAWWTSDMIRVWESLPMV